MAETADPAGSETQETTPEQPDMAKVLRQEMRQELGNLRRATEQAIKDLGNEVKQAVGTLGETVSQAVPKQPNQMDQYVQSLQGDQVPEQVTPEMYAQGLQLQNDAVLQAITSMGERMDGVTERLDGIDTRRETDARWSALRSEFPDHDVDQIMAEADQTARDKGYEDDQAAGYANAVFEQRLDAIRAEKQAETAEGNGAETNGQQQSQQGVQAVISGATSDGTQPSAESDGRFPVVGGVVQGMYVPDGPPIP